MGKFFKQKRKGNWVGGGEKIKFKKKKREIREKERKEKKKM